MKNLIIKNISSGITIGAIVLTICMLIGTNGNEIIIQVAAWLVASALYGLASIIFESEKIKRLPATCIHFIICMMITVFTAFLLGYADNILIILKTIFPLFLIIYALIYSSLFFISTINARQLSRVLEKTK